MCARFLSVFMSAALLIKLLARKSLLDWQGLVLAAPRAPAQHSDFAEKRLTNMSQIC